MILMTKNYVLFLGLVIFDLDLINSDIGLYNILPNPDKSDESDPDVMLNTPSSEYYSMGYINTILHNRNHFFFSIAILGVCLKL